MRTTIEIKDEHRGKLLHLAAQRGEKGFSAIIGEAIHQYLDAEAERETRRKRAIALSGSLSAQETDRLRDHVKKLRGSWRS